MSYRSETGGALVGGQRRQEAKFALNLCARPNQSARPGEGCGCHDREQGQRDCASTVGRLFVNLNTSDAHSLVHVMTKSSRVCIQARQHSCFEVCVCACCVCARVYFPLKAFICPSFCPCTQLCFVLLSLHPIVHVCYL